MNTLTTPATERVRHAVLAMPVAQTLQLRFRSIEAGTVELELPINEAFSFRPGQLQATAIFAAADFAADALAAMDALNAQGKVPILAGGTGLYFHALLHGLSSMPQADPELRAQLMDEARTRGWDALHTELAAHDPPAGARNGRETSPVAETSCCRGAPGRRIIGVHA